MEFTNYRTILSELVRLSDEGDEDGLSAHERDGYYLFVTDTDSPLTTDDVLEQEAEKARGVMKRSGKRLVYSMFDERNPRWAYHLFIVEKPS